FDLVMVASLGDRDATEHVRTLIDANLVTSTAPDRYAMHDLLREYAGELLDAEHESGLALTTVMHTYLGWANMADLALRPRRDVVLEIDPVPDTGLITTSDALAWFDREGANLTAAVLFTAEREPELCWKLALTLHAWLDRRRHMNENIEIYT